ncbi:hypothetical protein FHX46_001196 [Amycolatopsis viridis]|uniref:Uncharacterized protein n=1 Tax=Amycolatopsis viridis TaxID=185678 RepID=A0ABX0STJ4_9PSEU|nr:hypothetical protein [Amycolatopsis viridis]
MSELASESPNTMPADVITLPRLAATDEEAA